MFSINNFDINNASLCIPDSPFPLPQEYPTYPPSLFMSFPFFLIAP